MVKSIYKSFGEVLARLTTLEHHLKEHLSKNSRSEHIQSKYIEYSLGEYNEIMESFVEIKKQEKEFFKHFKKIGDFEKATINSNLWYSTADVERLYRNVQARMRTINNYKDFYTKHSFEFDDVENMRFGKIWLYFFSFIKQLKINQVIKLIAAVLTIMSSIFGAGYYVHHELTSNYVTLLTEESRQLTSKLTEISQERDQVQNSLDLEKERNLKLITDIEEMKNLKGNEIPDPLVLYYQIQGAVKLDINGREKQGAGSSLSNISRFFVDGIKNLKNGLNEEAKLNFEKVIEIKPFYPYAYYYQGLTCNNLGQNKNATESLNRAVELFDLLLKLEPNMSHYYLYKGACLTFLNKGQQSVGMLTKVYELEKDIDFFFKRSLPLLEIERKKLGGKEREFWEEFLSRAKFAEFD